MHRVWPLIAAGVLAIAAAAPGAAKPVVILVQGKEGAVLPSPAAFVVDCTVERGKAQVGMSCNLRRQSGQVVERSWVVGIGRDGTISLGKIEFGGFTPVYKRKGRSTPKPSFGQFSDAATPTVLKVRPGAYYGFAGTSGRCTLSSPQALTCVVVDAKGRPVAGSYGFTFNFVGVTIFKLDAQLKPHTLVRKRHGA